MSIHELIENRKLYERKIKQYSNELRKLRKLKITIDDSIMQYLKRNNLPGIRYKGDDGKTIKLVTENKDKYKSNPKPNQIDQCKTILRQNGIPSSKHSEIINQIFNTKHGDKITQTVLKTYKK